MVAGGSPERDSPLASPELSGVCFLAKGLSQEGEFWTVGWLSNVGSGWGDVPACSSFASGWATTFGGGAEFAVGAAGALGVVDWLP